MAMKLTDNLASSNVEESKSFIRSRCQPPSINAHGDWVYEEEIFNRNGKAYWWSPDGKQIAFLRFDDGPVRKFNLVDLQPVEGRLNSYAYSKPGDPNPLVKIGVVSYSTLAKARRYMIIINLILGAVLTTPEPITQLVMFVPLQLLYEITVWIAWYWDRQERKKAVV